MPLPDVSKSGRQHFRALVATPNESLEWTRGEPAVFKSSAHIERGFCSQCGTPLFYNDLENDRINLTIGSLDQPEQFPPHTQFGMESRLAWFGDLTGLGSAGETGAGDFKAWALAIEETSRQHPDHDTDSWPSSGEEIN